VAAAWPNGGLAVVRAVGRLRARRCAPRRLRVLQQQRRLVLLLLPAVSVVQFVFSLVLVVAAAGPDWLLQLLVQQKRVGVVVIGQLYARVVVGGSVCQRFPRVLAGAEPPACKPLRRTALRIGCTRLTRQARAHGKKKEEFRPEGVARRK
jgi:hypothetical protein